MACVCLRSFAYLVYVLCTSVMFCVSCVCLQSLCRHSMSCMSCVCLVYVLDALRILSISSVSLKA